MGVHVGGSWDGAAEDGTGMFAERAGESNRRRAEDEGGSPGGGGATHVDQGVVGRRAQSAR